MNKVWLVLVCCILFSSFYFFFQHDLEHNWDLMVYEMNALRYQGVNHYFEWYRPPALSFLFSELIALDLDLEVLFLINSTLILGGLVLLSRKWGFDELFVVLITFSSPIFLNYACLTGSDGLSLGFLIMSLSVWPGVFSGVLFGLSVLSRYTMIVFLPLFFFMRNKSVKSIILFFLAVILTVFPWFLFNYQQTGSPVYSFLDSYKLNVGNRRYLSQPLSPVHLCLVLGVFTLLFPFALSLELSPVLWVWLIVSFFTYFSVPLKLPRYTLNLVPPASMVITGFLEKLKEHKNLVLAVFVGFNLVLSFFVLSAMNLSEYGRDYREVADFVDGCASLSNVWVPLNYFGAESMPPLKKESVEKFLDEGYYLVVLNSSLTEPDYLTTVSFLQEHNIVFESGRLFVVSDTGECLKPGMWEYSYQRILDRG